MAEDEIKMEEKKKAKAEPLEKAGTLKLKTSVKTYLGGIEAEKQRMSGYTKKMQNEFKRHSKEMKEAGRNMIEEGNMKMSSSVKLFLSEINRVKKDFQAYTRAFWG